MLPAGSAARKEEEAESGGASELDHHGGVLGLGTVSTAINLAACEPPAGLDKNAYFLALSGIFLAGVANVFAAVKALNDPRGRAGGARNMLKYASVVAPFVVGAGLSVASFLW